MDTVYLSNAPEDADLWGYDGPGLYRVEDARYLVKVETSAAGCCAYCSGGLLEDGRCAMCGEAS